MFYTDQVSVNFSGLILKKILVIGGAGYIGSHASKLLAQDGYSVTVLDNLSTGHRDSVKYGELVVGDLSDRSLLTHLMMKRAFDAVMHFASSIEVSESVKNPRKYYGNNLVNSINVLDAMVDSGVKNLIFSSSAAVYGEPSTASVDETSRVEPINPYGRSKAMVEQIISDYKRTFGLACTSLRYFNAAGADPDGELGELHEPETHLIPLAIKAAQGVLPGIKVYGTDYESSDGTCVRDFVHVVDICSAHILALEKLLDGDEGDIYNLGSGRGYTVNEVLRTLKKISGVDFSVEYAKRRPGDPDSLVADSTKIRRELGWNPRFDDLSSIVQTAWNFYVGNS